MTLFFFFSMWQLILFKAKIKKNKKIKLINLTRSNLHPNYSPISRSLATSWRIVLSKSLLYLSISQWFYRSSILNHIFFKQFTISWFDLVAYNGNS